MAKAKASPKAGKKKTAATAKTGKLRAAAKAGDFDALAKAALKPGRTLPPAPASNAGIEAKVVPFGSVFPSPLNPRRQPAAKAELMALADSIVAEGILQSLLVRPAAAVMGQGYEIINGERRWRAVKAAIADRRLAKDYLLPVRVRAASDAELVEWAAVENMARQDMHPLDEAAAIAALRRFHPDDGEIARRLGLPERTLYRRVALLRLAPELQDDLRAGKITQQQAGAFALGTPADQLEQRKRLANGSYYSAPDAIRRAMLEKRVPVAKAMFPLADYSGEILTDPDDGKRYFANVAKFKELQDAAIAAKVKALKAEWPWVKEVQSYQPSGYRRLKKGETDAKAGAIHWRDTYSNEWHCAAPVLDPNASRKIEAAERGAAAAQDEAAERRYEELNETVAAHFRATPHAALAIAALRAIEDFGAELDQCHPEKAPARVRALVDAVEPVLRPVLEQADAAGDTFLEQICEGLPRTKEVGVAAYRALAALPAEQLLTIFLLASRPWDWCIDGDGLNPLGMIVMQRELPLETGKEKAA